MKGPENKIFTTAEGEVISGERRPEDIDVRVEEAVKSDFEIAQKLNNSIKKPRTNPMPEK